MINKHVLNNGVRIIIEKMPSVRSVSLGVWVGTGSKYETEKNNGISHFIEHMLFKGTQTKNAKEIAESFDSIGGHVNAFTSKEYTCYYAKVLDEHFDIALNVLADMFFNSTFDPIELNKEKKVVIEEINMYEDTPDDLVHDLIAEASYGNHPLGYSILGTEENLNRFTREDVIQYISQHYLPENTVITISGNVSETILEKVERKFSFFSNKIQENIVPLPTFLGSQVVRQKTTEQAHLCLSFPGYAVGDSKLYPLILLNNILGGSMSSRLFQEIREERGLAYSVFSYHSSFKDSGLFTIYAGTAPHQLDEVFSIITENIQKVKDEGITEGELNKGKEQLKGSLMLSLESTNSRMSRLGKNELLLGYHISLDQMIQKINEINLEDIKKVSHDLFSQPLALSMVSPKDQLPKGYRRNLFV
ncbi:insulinase family protein [Microaerobacter geothermalis]|uniref:M16 family metallopeptidase n=1 Tax=Microaerobacter geothermalis TaxID=674972 RepID=UPI001F224A21|nr:pitrilysin family protein [Microaerobacter geothermalis]MCF6093182.1 insulinase family protein [Microaerobacter geothermalis]